MHPHTAVAMRRALCQASFRQVRCPAVTGRALCGASTALTNGAWSLARCWQPRCALPSTTLAPSPARSPPLTASTPPPRACSTGAPPPPVFGMLSMSGWAVNVPPLRHCWHTHPTLRDQPDDSAAAACASISIIRPCIRFCMSRCGPLQVPCRQASAAVPRASRRLPLRLD